MHDENEFTLHYRDEIGNICHVNTCTLDLTNELLQAGEGSSIKIVTLLNYFTFYSRISVGKISLDSSDTSRCNNCLFNSLYCCDGIMCDRMIITTEYSFNDKSLFLISYIRDILLGMRDYVLFVPGKNITPDELL